MDSFESKGSFEDSNLKKWDRIYSAESVRCDHSWAQMCRESENHALMRDLLRLLTFWPFPSYLSGSASRQLQPWSTVINEFYVQVHSNLRIVYVFLAAQQWRLKLYICKQLQIVTNPSGGSLRPVIDIMIVTAHAPEILVQCEICFNAFPNTKCLLHQNHVWGNWWEGFLCQKIRLLEMPF